MASDLAAPMTGAGFLASNEADLATGAPAVRVGVVGSPVASFGVGQSLANPCAERARAVGWEVVHRRSGGTGLYHAPGDLLWSVVLPRSDPRVGRDFPSAYGRLGAGVTAFLKDLGVEGDWTAASAAAPDYCLLSGRGCTLNVHGRAVAGAAQHATRVALLHHGALCRSLDPRPLGEVFQLPAATARAKLVGLEQLGVRRPSAELAVRLHRALREFVDGPRD